MFHLDQRTTNFRPWLKARPRSLLLFQEHISKYFISLICLMCWFCPRQVSFNSKFKQELSVSQSLISPPICFGPLPPTEATLFLSRTQLMPYVTAVCKGVRERVGSFVGRLKDRTRMRNFVVHNFPLLQSNKNKHLPYLSQDLKFSSGPSSLNKIDVNIVMRLPKMLTWFSITRSFGV